MLVQTHVAKHTNKAYSTTSTTTFNPSLAVNGWYVTYIIISDNTSQRSL